MIGMILDIDHDKVNFDDVFDESEKVRIHYHDSTHEMRNNVQDDNSAKEDRKIGDGGGKADYHNMMTMNDCNNDVGRVTITMTMTTHQPRKMERKEIIKIAIACCVNACLDNSNYHKN